MTTYEPAIKLQSIWTQSTLDPANGKPTLRVVEVIERPTLSRPATVKIIRNDKHPHRVGKVARMTASKLRRVYQAVA